MLCCVSSLLTMPAIVCSVGEWLLHLVFQACSRQMSWILQCVSSCHDSCISSLLTQCLSFALQRVSDCYVLLYFKPADTCSPLLSWWLAVLPCCFSPLLIMPVFNSPVGEWLPSCNVSRLLMTHYPCPWLSSWWVVAMPHCISIHVDDPYFCSQVRDWGALLHFQPVNHTYP